jgi:hypothetical protein
VRRLTWQAMELLTQTIMGSKSLISDYLAGFDRFSFLWQHDIATDYAKFVATSPKLRVHCSALSSSQLPNNMWSCQRTVSVARLLDAAYSKFAEHSFEIL